MEATKKNKEKEFKSKKKIKEELFYAPENGKRTSRVGYYIKKIKAEGGGVKIIDMEAVLN
ncbi:hypothetical protein AB4865_12325 [Capnocytophaga sp. ARDL2]|uniref:hypothetical protein n=1 Tax=Capnocytophaga sp. ARDL2 TaxID=3238809 RepID=UPI003555D9FD